MAQFEGLAQIAPATQVGMAQVVLAKDMEPGDRRGESADRAAHDSCCRGVDPPAGTTLVVADGAEALLQGVVRPGQAGDVVAVEQAGPVAGADLEEVGNGRLECADSRLVVADLGEQVVHPLAHLGPGELVLVFQESCRSMHPTVGDPDGRPHRVCSGEPFGDERS